MVILLWSFDHKDYKGSCIEDGSLKFVLLVFTFSVIKDFLNINKSLDTFYLCLITLVTKDLRLTPDPVCVLY